MSIRAIAVCASGPSLRSEDVYRLRANRIPIITVNSSWMIDPDCQYIFAGDKEWWDNNYFQINSPAQLWTCNEDAARTYKINYFEENIEGTLNSGMMAILFSISLGTEDIILLGYDCSLEKGIHWHGRHTDLNNPTGYSILRWKKEFEIMASETRRRVNIINCSRESILTCFPRVSLESTLLRIKRINIHG